MAVTPPWSVLPVTGYAPGGVSYYPPPKKKTNVYDPAADLAAAVATRPPATGGAPGSAPNTSAQFANYAGQITLPGGAAPDWGALIMGSPEVLAAQGDLSSAGTMLGGIRRGQIRSAVVRAGLAPDRAVGDVDAETLAQAAGNQYSDRAALDVSRGRAESSLLSALAGRGISRSGALTGGNRRIGRGYGEGINALVGKLMGQIGGYENDYSTKYWESESAYNKAKVTAESRIRADPSLVPPGPTDAILDPDSGLYVTSDGRWFDRHRNPVSAPTRGVGGAVVPPVETNAAGQTALQAALTGGQSPYTPPPEYGPPITYTVPEGGYEAPPNVPVAGYQYPYYYGGQEGSVYAE